VSLASPEGWIRLSVAQRWPGTQPAAIVALKGDASTRRFWRVTLQAPRLGGGAAPPVPPSAIAIDLGPDDLPLYARALALVPEPLPEPPWLSLQRYLRTIDVAVPELYFADGAARMLLVEDVGEIALFDAAGRGGAGDLYRLAADQLLRFHLEGTRRLPPDCVAARVAYDERLFRWELEQFAAIGAEVVAPGIDRAAIAPELDDLAARLGRRERVFAHRDYHGHNLFVQFGPAEPALRVIDFQDALMAPAAQDLAVLLTTRDTSRIITARVEQRVLEYYYAALLRRERSPAFDDFMESYRLCVLQHALKVIGRFVYLERNGKSGYAEYLPFALAQARRMIARGTDFPALRAALSE
jgi:aminoglycoside/choline kinase family phosphotransferase